MKIGIEAQRIFRKGKHGMDVVALELIRQFQAIDNTHEYLLFAKKGEDRNCIIDTPRFKTTILNGLTYADWEQVSLPAAVRKLKPDILHCTANTAPLSISVPTIVTIHDVIFLEETGFKGSSYQNFGNLYRKYVVPLIIKKARTIITVSEYEKSVIEKVCKTDPSKIVVVHNGVDNRFHPRIPQHEREAFIKLYNIPDKFILFHGNTAPKKNSAGMIKAYVQYCSSSDHPLPLVITDYSESLVRKHLEKLGRPELIKNISMPGYIPVSVMPVLYNCSSLFVYPSFRESFGLPVLEAMACGIPVIASGIPAVREVAGNAAAFFDPENSNTIADAMITLLSDESIIADMKQKGLVRASQFSWEKAAKKMIEIYTTSIASP